MLDIDNFSCKRCDHKIEPWAVRCPRFICPGCGKEYQSNYKALMKRSLYIFVATWLVTGFLILMFTSSWQVALALSIELGWVGGILVAVSLFRLSLRIDESEC
ncbi:MAG: hypothetical protein ABW185_16710 [Sedimenticola sp.]